MKTIRYSIAPEIFTNVPGYIRGLVVINHLDNTRIVEIQQQELRRAEATLKASFTTETLLADMRITSWREAFKKFGMNPGEFRPAHEALARRAVQDKPLPFINAAVDIGNAASLCHLTPIGVHPLDEVNSDLSLGLAAGFERFTAFGSEKMESPKQGEVILAEGENVFTRCWVWRQSQQSITLPTAKRLVVNVDVLPPLTMADAERVTRKVAESLLSACGGEQEVMFLSLERPSVLICPG